MLRLRRILFPTDFSACAEGAFTHAAYLAQRAEAELHVLHVVEGELEAPADGIRDLRITPDDIAADLDIPLPVSPDPKPGGFVPLIDAEEHAEEAAPAILRYIEAHAVDLVVMGTHGRRGLRRMLMGSVAEEVVRLAPCPVFTVGGREGRWAIRHIVAPVDFSEHAALAARHAAALAEVYDADLTLLHVIDAARVPTGPAPILGPARVSFDEAHARAQKRLDRLAADLRTERPSVGDIGVHVRFGHPSRDIIAFAEEHEADLVVVGSHGRTGVERLLMGSVAEQVVRAAPCPVFTVKSFGRALLPSAPVLGGAEPAAAET